MYKYRHTAVKNIPLLFVLKAGFGGNSGWSTVLSNHIWCIQIIHQNPIPEILSHWIIQILWISLDFGDYKCIVYPFSDNPLGFRLQVYLHTMQACVKANIKNQARWKFYGIICGCYKLDKRKNVLIRLIYECNGSEYS